ncbi:MAG: hypothetical protein KIT22_19675, partial [Verrucomicrobiae bacterium]|nr:hypothetical protein [Verrucomicrobiae bacterium]
MIGSPGRLRQKRGDAALGLLAWCILAAGALDAIADEKPVSWHRDITPIFKRSCNGCHNPNKLKGEVDTSSYAGFLKPGKHGPNWITGDADKSLVLEQIRGGEPDMPKDADPLSEAEVALIARWIQEGAKDDTPADAGPRRPDAPPSYAAPPVTTALAVSPDGRWLAASGYHEVFLMDAASLETRQRLLGDSPRLESLAFSPDSMRLAVAGGAPAQFGEIQIWEAATHR